MRIHHRLGALVATLTLFVAPAAFACGGYSHQAPVVYAPAPAPVVYAPAPAPIAYQTAGYNAHHHNKAWLQATRVRMNAPVVYAKPVVVVQAPHGHHGHHGKQGKTWGKPGYAAPTVVVQPAPQHGPHGKQGHGKQGHGKQGHGKHYAHAGTW